MTADQRSYNLDVKHKYFYMDRRSWRGACGLNWDGGWHLPRLLSFLYVEFIFVLLWKTSLLVWWKSLNWSNSESKGPADPECWDRLINSWKYVAMWCHTLSAQPISRFLLMCAFKFDNCIDCRAWEGFWETAVTSPDWMKVFDAPESPREISPRFSDCALAVMGFMAANYPARIESKCKCRQQRSSPVYQGTSRAWHWHCWMVRQIGTISAVLLGRREIVRKIRNNWGSSCADIRKRGKSRSFHRRPRRWPGELLSCSLSWLSLHAAENNSTTKGDKKGRTWLQLQLSSCVEVLSNPSLDVCRN